MALTYALRVAGELVVLRPDVLFLAAAGLKRVFAVFGLLSRANGLSATRVAGVGVVVVEAAGLPLLLEIGGLFNPVARAKGERGCLSSQALMLAANSAGVGATR